MKILAVQNRMGIGDMIIFLPFIEAISKKYKVPIIGLGLGEKEDDLQIFNAEKFASAFTRLN